MTIPLPPGFRLPEPLYALTLSQPWPQMFMLDENPKRLENRMWAPPREQLMPGGWFALHGGRLPKSTKEFEEVREALEWVNEWVFRSEEDEYFYDDDILELCVTGLFGLARFRGVTQQRGQLWRTRDRYAWILDDFIPLPSIPARGNRDLWAVTDEPLNRLRQHLGLDPVPLTLPSKAPAPTPAPSPAIRTPEGLFTPGVAVASLPARPEHRRMYGLRAGDDWVSVICERDKGGSETYVWCSRLTSGAGKGNRRAFETWLGRLRQVAA